MSQPAKTCRILVIGDEILTGKVVDTNSPYILKRLRRLGVPCTGVEVLPDRIERIVERLQEAMDSTDYIFTTGGVGPTHDDVTVEAVARAVGQPLVRNEQLAALLEERWKGPPAPARMRMAMLPANAELIDTPYFPQVRVGPIFVFPGVPRLLRLRFPAIEGLLEGQPVHCTAIYTLESEGELAPKLEAVAGAFPSVQIGSYPTWDEEHYRVLITLESSSKDEVKAASAALEAELDAPRHVETKPEYRPEQEEG